MKFFSPFAWLGHEAAGYSCRTAVFSSPSLETSVAEVAKNLKQNKTADLCLVFASTDYASDLPRLMPLLQERLSACQWLGCAGAGVIGTNAAGVTTELERVPAISVTLLTLPGSYLKTFSLDTHALPDLDGSAQCWQEWVGVDPFLNGSMLLFLDPLSPSINDLICGLDYAYPGTTIVGGIAGLHNANHGSLFINDRVVSGAVGCVFAGDWHLEAIAAKGCKPIGPIFEIDQVNRNVLLELRSEDECASPVTFLQKILAELSEEERAMARHSLFLGVEYRDLFIPWDGQPRDHGTFVTRNLIGVDPVNGAVAVAEKIRVGQNVQFQLREAEASRIEAEQLLDASLERSTSPVVFGLLMACLGRGKSLFGVSNGDVNIARKLINDLPIAGVMCNGEIGPVGNATHVHAYTACWALLRKKISTKNSDQF